MGNHDSWRHHIVVITVLAEYWVTFKVYMLRDHSEQAAPCPIVLSSPSSMITSTKGAPRSGKSPQKYNEGLVPPGITLSSSLPSCHPDNDLRPCSTWTQDQESHSRFTLKATSSRAQCWKAETVAASANYLWRRLPFKQAPEGRRTQPRATDRLENQRKILFSTSHKFSARGGSWVVLIVVGPWADCCMRQSSD